MMGSLPASLSVYFVLPLLVFLYFVPFLLFTALLSFFSTLCPLFLSGKLGTVNLLLVEQRSIAIELLALFQWTQYELLL